MFYVISPAKRIMGMATVASPIFEESRKAPWSDRLYPHRITITDVEPIDVRADDFLGKIISVKNRIPMGRSIIPFTQDDFEIIKNLAKRRN